MSSLRFGKLDVAASLGMFAYASSVVATPIILLRLAGELTRGRLISDRKRETAVRRGMLP